MRIEFGSIFSCDLHGIAAQSDYNHCVNGSKAVIAKKKDLVWDQFCGYNEFIPVQNMTEKVGI